MVGGDGCCPDCDGQLVGDNEPYCAECGLVIDDNPLRPEQGAENRVAAAGRGGRRLGTNVGSSGDFLRGSLQQNQRRRAIKMRRWQRRLREDEGGTTERCLREVDRLVPALSLSTSVGETAGVLVRRGADEGLQTGRSIEAVAGATVYLAAKMERYPRTIPEVERVARVKSEAYLRRAIQTYNKKLGLPVPPTDPERFLPRVADKLSLGPEEERRARRLIKQGRSENLFVGRSPPKVAVASLYTAANQLKNSDNIADDSEPRYDDDGDGQADGRAISQREVAASTDISPSGLSKLYQLIVGQSDD